MLAAMNGHNAAVKMLLDMDSDINTQIQTNRNTALTLACFQGRHEVVNIVIAVIINIVICVIFNFVSLNIVICVIDHVFFSVNQGSTNFGKRKTSEFIQTLTNFYKTTNKTLCKKGCDRKKSI